MEEVLDAQINTRVPRRVPWQREALARDRGLNLEPASRIG